MIRKVLERVRDSAAFPRNHVPNASVKTAHDDLAIGRQSAKNRERNRHRMGATGWSYFVPYEADISAALQRLREDVFARGDFDQGPSEDEVLSAVNALKQRGPEFDAWIQKCKEAAATLPEWMRAMYIENAERMRKEIMEYGSSPAKPPKKPKTIKALLKQRAESGTHSILDITCVSAHPEFGAVTPFPNDRLSEIFHSETPSHADIENAYGSESFEEFMSERWQGIYVIAYRDGKPDEIFFAGHSGD